MHFSQATIAAVVAAGFVSAAPTIEKRAHVTDGKTRSQQWTCFHKGSLANSQPFSRHPPVCSDS